MRSPFARVFSWTGKGKTSLACCRGCWPADAPPIPASTASMKAGKCRFINILLFGTTSPSRGTRAVDAAVFGAYAAGRHHLAFERIARAEQPDRRIPGGNACVRRERLHGRAADIDAAQRIGVFR